MQFLTRCVVTFVLLWSFGWNVGWAIQAQDWPTFRGPEGTGHLKADGILANDRKIGLKLRWKRQLGSGYSSVVVAKQRVIAMYCDDSNDLVGCFNATDGTLMWSVPIGKKYKGENGSFDGPISTPVVHDDAVYCLSPTGKFFCLSLADGKQNWVRDLVTQENARKPMYGFATSPLVVDETVIVQAGGSTKSLVALDRATGETKWAGADDSIDSQSPALLTIEGQLILLAAGGKKLTGVDPSDGKVLFEHVHGGGNGSAMVPVVYDEDKVLLTLDDGFSSAVSIRKIGDGYQVSELWKRNSIKNTYNVPVEFDEHLFAYSTRILTCVDAATGQPKWKSREPGDGFLIVVDGHVILNTKKGALHVLKATPDAYELIASEQVFEDLVWSLPAYSQGAVFMRSLGELACVDLVGETSIAKTNAKRPIGQQFGAMLENAANSDDAQAVVDAYLAKFKSFPLVEDGMAHFVFQGDANDVAVAGDMFGARQERKMRRIGTTNTWYYALKLPEDVRVNYVFLVDYKPQTDPLNPKTEQSSIYAGEMEFAVRLRNEAPLKMSWFGMPKWKQPSFVAPVETLRGKLVELEVPSELLKSPHKIEVYVPPGYDEAIEADGPRFPVVYVYGGSEAKRLGRLHEVADNLFSNDHHVPKAILVFFDAAPGPKFLETIAGEIVPFVDGKFNTQADRTARLCLSNGLSASVAIQLVSQHPDVFGAASVQTPLIFDLDQQRCIDGINQLKQPARLFFEWGMYDMFNPDENWDSRKIGKRLFDEFSKSEHVTIRGGEVPDSTDWSSWRNRFDQILELLDLPTGGSD